MTDHGARAIRKPGSGDLLLVDPVHRGEGGALLGPGSIIATIEGPQLGAVTGGEVEVEKPAPRSRACAGSAFRFSRSC